MSDYNQPGTAPASAPKFAPGLISRIRTYFLTGLIVAGPVAITAWLIWWFVTWVDSLVRPLIPAAYHPDTYLPFNIPGLGLIFAFIMLTLLGFLTANFVGRRLVGFGESLLSRMPIVRPIYRTAKQIFETLFSSSESSFRQVGLVEFPSPGMWSLVFLTQAPGAPIAARLPDGEHVSAFMPCTPEPNHRFLLLRAAARGDRSRHFRRAGDAAHHLGRRHSARRRRSAKEPCDACGDSEGGAGGPDCGSRIGKIAHSGLR